MQNKVILGYWNIRGIAQVSRYLLEYCQVEFVDKQYSDDDTWFKVDKFALGLDFPNLPYLIDGDFKLTESKAIERYIIGRQGKQDELLGKDVLEQVTQTQIVSLFGDLSASIDKLISKNKDEIEKIKGQSYETDFKQKLAQLSKFLGGQKFLTGECVKYADFHGYEIVSLLKNIFSESFKEWTNLEQWLTNFEEIPSIKSYMQSQRYRKAPYYNQLY